MLRSVAGAEPKRRFGANVRRHRLRLELSQEALGFKCGLHPTEISRLERAKREPRLGTIVVIARALELKPSELLEGIN
jgi:transcriptional regulator with XRE-family HTH domain